MIDWKKVKPRFFKDQNSFRKWLEKNHQKKDDLFVGFYKVKSGKLNMTWSESVDQALCFGWIDGIRKTIDEERYCIRFTPRNPKSNWSAVNIKKVKELTKKGLMQPAGIEAYNLLKTNNAKIYSYEKSEAKFSKEFEKLFKLNKLAWKYFQSMSPSYQKLATNWVMSAKRDETRIKRLNELIADSEIERKVKPLSY